MAVKFFGQFLVERGVISRDVLLSAIALQDLVNKSFGAIVQELGFMNSTDIDKVNLAQRSTDMRFGDLAVQMGLLTADQMQQVLKTQSENHLYIGKAIVKVGGLNDDELQHYLAEFKADQSEYVTGRVAIPAGVAHAELWEMMADLTYKMLTRVARLNYRPAPCEVVSRLEEVHIAAAMDFTGDIRCRYIIAASQEVQEQVAKAMLCQEIVSHEPKEVLDDTLMEFINVVCGNIVAKSVQLGMSLDILPPEIIDCSSGMEIPDGYTGLHFPICIADSSQEAAVSIIVYP